MKATLNLCNILSKHLVGSSASIEVTWKDNLTHGGEMGDLWVEDEKWATIDMHAKGRRNMGKVAQCDENLRKGIPLWTCSHIYLA